MRYLINPSERSILENSGDRIPYGLLSIATEQGDTKIFDLNHYSEEQMMKEFNKDKPESVGISVYTSPIYNEAVRLSKRFKGKTKLIAGGYHATAMPETLDMFDEVVIGKAIPDFSKTKSVDFSLIDLNNYGIKYGSKTYGTLISSVGCPFDCSFCFNMSRKVQYKNVKELKKEIDTMSNFFDGIYFLDDVFTLKKDRMEEIMKYVSNKGLEARVTTRADLIDDDKMKILSDNGVKWISLGIESGDNTILRNINKKMTVEDNKNAVELANKYGIQTKGFFIIGLPGETETTARKTINHALTLKDSGMTHADFYFLTPFPGTPIWNNPDKFGITINNKDFTKYLQAGKNAECFVNTKELSSNRIEELVKEAKLKWQK